MRRLPRLFILLFFTFFFSISAFAQDAADSIPRQIPKEVTYGYELEDMRLRYPIDTGLSRFHYYDPVDKLDFLYRNTGALGGASFRMVCCEQQPMGFRIGYEQFNLYRFTEGNVPFYNNVRPYSQLNLLIGLKKEQTASVVHSQNIGKKFNFGFHYLRFATVGAYVNQRTRHNDIALTTTYDTQKRYSLKTLLVHNNVRSEENGGVEETSIYKDTSFLSKELVGVELESAESRQREISFRLRQSIKDYIPVVVDTAANDTIAGDSTKVALLPVLVPTSKWEVYHEFDISRIRYEYSDGAPDTAFYGIFFPEVDTITTEFKYETRKVSVGTRAGFKKSFGKAFIVDASAGYAYHLIQQHGFDNGHTHYADAKLSVESDMTLPFSYAAEATYSFTGYNQGDFKTNAFVRYTFKKVNVLQGNATWSRVAPALLYQRFSFRSVTWLNEFEKQSLLTVEARYIHRKWNFQAAIRFNQINQFLYFDEDKLPAQHSGTLPVIGFELRKLFRFNYFGFDNILYVQLVSDKALQRYPVYWGVHSFYYERGAFKGKLLTRVGIDIRYNTNYKAPGYFPLTGQFYLQDEEQLTFYPTLDFYLCFKIKTARLFFKMQHLNQGMFKDNGYFNAYKYPATDRTFRFGLSWMFLD